MFTVFAIGACIGQLICELVMPRALPNEPEAVSFSLKNGRVFTGVIVFVALVMNA